VTRRISGALILFGVLFLADGTWIYTKARLAQLLLLRAWGRTVRGERNARPWPWADTHPVARLRIESTEADYIVLAGASGRTLAFGPAHVDGTPLPGRNGNCVISAHRDTQFAALEKLRAGDVLQLTTPDRKTHHYRVSGTRVVDKHDTSVLRSGSRPQLTLITCFPFDAVVPGGPLRYIVDAEM
jgi:sortase A